MVYDAYTWTDFSKTAPIFGQLGGGFAAIALSDPSWLTPEGQARYDLDEHFTRIGYGLLQLGADHNREEIASYVAGGGRLLSWHAAGDNLLSAREHGRMFDDLTRRIERLGIENPSDNAVYLQVPTNQHGAGQGLREVDWMTAIINWVEKDTHPSGLVYRFKADDGTRRSLPVCEYPKYPAYKDGDVNHAASYECRAN
ncbi:MULTISPECIES: tannase/feruloyl esterase family alpha/beta hydrolase [Arsenicicoccus]|uniref:tannase/feruloyl esterase family alpha/beta hydrolase n=1 Tax=Arsenicicoccus TaxID=267408 RepID=UPI00257CE671|nr:MULTISPECIES: tannase/feruloyl esterase family alpha/beta hydrolase [Arsenicicoccus]